MDKNHINNKYISGHILKVILLIHQPLAGVPANSGGGY